MASQGQHAGNPAIGQSSSQGYHAGEPKPGTGQRYNPVTAKIETAPSYYYHPQTGELQQQGRIQRSVSFISRHTPPPRTSPGGGALGNSRLLIMLWFVAMILVASDEWKQGFKPFPRPARLWYTSLTFAILMAVSQINATIPNLLAIGFDIQLAYENVSGSAFTLFGINLTGGSTAASAGSGVPAASQRTTGPGVTHPVAGS